MKRCFTVFFCAAALLPALAGAQTTDSGTVGTASSTSTTTTETGEFTPNIRKFPKNAMRGELMVLAAPDATMDGKADRLSPAVRIRDPNNFLILSGTISGKKLLVNYVRDNIGLVQQVWILSAAEAKQKLPGQPETGISGVISNIRSAFDKPVTGDNGKTPYDQLPRY